MSFIDIFKQSVKSGFQNYATFKGRSSRMTFWCWTLFIVSVSAIMNVLTLLGTPAISLISTIFALITFIPNIAIHVRRFHDINLSGWAFLGVTLLAVFISSAFTFIFLGDQFMNMSEPPQPSLTTFLTTIPGLLILLYFLVKKGDEKANKYGEPPVL